MKRMLAILLIVGILVAGTSVAAEVSEENSFEDIDFTDEYIDDFGDPNPCGGGGGGAPDVPG